MLKQGSKRETSWARLFFAIKDVEQLRCGLALIRILAPARCDCALDFGDGAVFRLAGALIVAPHTQTNSIF